MNQSYPDNIRAFSVSEELATASKLIQRGLKELQDPDIYQTFLYLPLLLLSNGFERFFKAIFCCWYYDKYQRYPTIDELKGKNGKKGHDLLFHLNRVLEACFTEEYKNRCQAGMQDYIFLTEDQKCLALMKILAEFGQRDRYYHLDVVVGLRGDRNGYDEKWGGELERHMIENNPAWLEALFDVGNNVPELMAKEIIITIERATRGVSRLMTLGNIGELAKMNSPYFFCFIKIMDSELGKRRY